MNARTDCVCSHADGTGVCGNALAPPRLDVSARSYVARVHVARVHVYTCTRVHVFRGHATTIIFLVLFVTSQFGMARADDTKFRLNLTCLQIILLKMQCKYDMLCSVGFASVLTQHLSGVKCHFSCHMCTRVHASCFARFSPATVTLIITMTSKPSARVTTGTSLVHGRHRAFRLGTT
jgi:hypothetical protein